MTLEQEARDLMERAGWEGAQNATAGDVIEVAGIIRCLRQAEDVIIGLERGGSPWTPSTACWCEMGIGNPMVTEHSTACVEAAAMAAELATQIRYLDNEAKGTFSWQDQPAEVLEAHADWIKSEGNGKKLKELSERLPPWGWYMLADDEVPMESRYQLLSYGKTDEGWRVTVIRISVASTEPMWRVFGIDPDTLIPANTAKEAQAELSPGEYSYYERRRVAAMERIEAAIAANKGEVE